MGRAPCCDKDGLRKGPWTPEEDQKLVDYIQKHGYGNWRTLPKNAGLRRCGKSCRLRWTNYLRPDIKRGRFSSEDEETIVQLHSILGNKWSAIAARLPGRTDNEIKNYWNTHIRKRLLRMGIDPVTHNPRLDLLDLSSILGSSLYNSPQINVTRLLGVQQQPAVNQELLRLATSLCSPQGGTHHDQYQPLLQDSQFQSPVQEMSNCTALTGPPCVPFSNESQIMDHIFEQYPSDHFSNVGSQNCQLNWQRSGMAASNLTEDYYVPSYCDNNYYGSDQSTMMDPPSVTSTFMSNNGNHSLSFAASVLSTPSSSSTAPLNSNSTAYINGSSSTEDERESYCSNILKFEIPDILHVNDPM